MTTIPTLILPAIQAGKPTLADLLNLHRLTAPTLARRAGVELSAIHAMLRRQPVSSYLATKVLVALNYDFRQRYRLADVDLVIEEGARR